MVLHAIGRPTIRAALLPEQRIDHNDGGIVELVLWRVPAPVPPSRHGLKYSLFYGYPGKREAGYDNERGKGDHRHILDVKTNYVFTTVEQPMAEFALWRRLWAAITVTCTRTFRLWWRRD